MSRLNELEISALVDYKKYPGRRSDLKPIVEHIFRTMIQRIMDRYPFFLNAPETWSKPDVIEASVVYLLDRLENKLDLYKLNTLSQISSYFSTIGKAFLFKDLHAHSKSFTKMLKDGLDGKAVS